MWRALLELLIPSVCPACDRPRAPGRALLCGACAIQLERWSGVGESLSVIAFRGVGRTLMHRIKFEGRRDALEVLMVPLIERLAPLPFEAVVAVPRHPDRIRSQGSDPAHALARELARRLGRELVENALVRARPTAPQSELRGDARRRNVAGAFRADPRALRGRPVLLLDDIVTTGATLEAAARALREQGRPARVWCAALAGTPPSPDLSARPPLAL